MDRYEQAMLHRLAILEKNLSMMKDTSEKLEHAYNQVLLLTDELRKERMLQQLENYLFLQKVAISRLKLKHCSVTDSLVLWRSKRKATPENRLAY